MWRRRLVNARVRSGKNWQIKPAHSGVCAAPCGVEWRADGGGAVKAVRVLSLKDTASAAKVCGSQHQSNQLDRVCVQVCRHRACRKVMCTTRAETSPHTPPRAETSSRTPQRAETSLYTQLRAETSSRRGRNVTTLRAETSLGLVHMYPGTRHRQVIEVTPKVTYAAAGD